MRRYRAESFSPTEGGLSAIEVLIAASVIAVALLAMISMFPGAYGSVVQSGRQTAAVALAQQRIELLRNLACGAAGLAAGTTFESSLSGHPGYMRTTLIEGDTPISGVQQVTVTVNMPRWGQSVQLTTLIAK